MCFPSSIYRVELFQVRGVGRVIKVRVFVFFLSSSSSRVKGLGVG